MVWRHRVCGNAPSPAPEQQQPPFSAKQAGVIPCGHRISGALAHWRRKIALRVYVGAVTWAPLLGSHANRTVESDDFSVEHRDGENGPNEFGEF